jgi:AMIN domain
VNGTNFQFALRQAGRSAPPFPAARFVCRQPVLSLVIALILAVLIAKMPLDASDVPSRSADMVGQPMNAAGVQLLGVRSSSQNDSSWVIIDLSANARYEVGHLSNPERVYLDFPQTEINSRLTTRRIAVQNGLIDQVRIGTSQGPVTRVVLDLAIPVRYRVTKVDNSTRMLIELRRPPEGAVLAESLPLSAEAPGATPASPDSKSSGALPAGRAAPSILQQGDIPPGSPSGPQTYGNGEKAGLNYAGTTSPRNILQLGLNLGSEYNDNVNGNNQQRVGDVDFLIGPSLSLRREGSRVSLSLSYQPNFLIYRNASELNTLNQSLGFDAAYRVSSRFSLRARTSAFYTNGILQPRQNEEFLPGLGSPTSLNQTVYTPTERQLALSSRIDANYQASLHDSFGLFVGESTLDFKQQVSSAGNLQNTQELDAGLFYQHRLSLHTTLGANYQFLDILFGPDSRTLVHSFFFSYAQQLSPSVTISVFGGPQHSHSNEIVPLAIGPFTFHIPVVLAGWNWAMGSTVTKRLDRTVFLVTAQHQVSNGGGLIGAVISTSIGASVRRQIPGRWDAVWSGNYAKNSSLGSGAPAGSYSSVAAGFGLERSFSDRVSLRLGYDYLSQHGSGQVPLLGDLKRDLFSIQFSYRFHQIALGQQ